MRTLLVISFLFLAAPSLAEDSQDRARDALERGDILPLSRILDVAKRDAGGRVINVELDRDDGRFIYEVEIITSDGRLLELSIDAATGRILDRDFEDD
ncbi:PepSY domain-containing protein [Ochrobactrum sp. BTU1]|uniref:PepSY domain-containing protein n=1 Tax=Ochrobactrum sp. BTU1 TaxID=2840456 RepID=UPI001C056BFE|nr:PepSY domain-containing protein [Ochrobactrum sp. BTU1]